MQTYPTATTDIEKKRFLWLCRRGIREMDLLFKQYINDHFDKLDEIQKKTLEALLNEPDLDILNWIMEREPVPVPDYSPIIETMKILNEKRLKEN